MGIWDWWTDLLLSPSFPRSPLLSLGSKLVSLGSPALGFGEEPVLPVCVWKVSFWTKQSGTSWHSGGVVYSSSYSAAASGLTGAQLIGIAHTAWSWRHTHTFSLSLTDTQKNTRTHLHTHAYTCTHTPLFSLSLHPSSFSASLLLFYTHHPSPSSFLFITIENSPPGEELFLTKFVWGSLSLF